MMLCVTPNPALDRYWPVPDLSLGQVNRAAKSKTTAGGNGVNAARAAAVLGSKVVCAGFLGGHTGRLLAELAEGEGLDCRWTWLSNETRTTLITMDAPAGQTTRIAEPGPAAYAEDWQRLHADVLRYTLDHRFICLGGSLPPGCSTEPFHKLVQTLWTMGCTTWVDVTGEALQAALQAGPVGVQVGAEAAGEVLGREVDNAEAACAAAERLREMGAGMVAITLDAEGALLSTGGGTWWAEPPIVEGSRAVGCGDAFLGGLVNAFETGRSLPAALRRASAAGAAKARYAGTRSFTWEDFRLMLHDTTVVEL